MARSKHPNPLTQLSKIIAREQLRQKHRTYRYWEMYSNHPEWRPSEPPKLHD